MAKHTLLLLLLLLLLLMVHAATAGERKNTKKAPFAFTDKNEVGLVTLTNATFPLWISQHEYSFIVFCTGWSKHCNDTMPEITLASEELSKNGTEFGVAVVDPEAFPDLKKRWDVFEYPTMRVHKGWFWSFEVPTEEQPRKLSDFMEYWSSVQAPDFVKPVNAVVELATPSVFFDLRKETPLMLVEFYAPWCTHCQDLSPQYARAARVLKNMSGTNQNVRTENITLARVNGATPLNKPLGEKYGVKGYPHFVLFRDGEPRDFTASQNEKGTVDAKAIVSFMEAQAGKLPEINSEISLANRSREVWLSDHMVNAFIVVGVFSSQSAGLQTDDYVRDLQLYTDLAKARPWAKAAAFFTCHDPTVAKFLHAKPGELVLLPAQPLRDGKPKRINLKDLRSKNVNKKGELTSGVIQTMLDKLTRVALPLVGLMTPGNTPFAEGSPYKLPIAIVFTDVSMKKDGRFSKVSRAWHAVVSKVARKMAKLAPKLQFVLAHARNFGPTIADLGLEAPSGYSAAVAVIDEKRQKYRMVGKASAAEFESFVTEFTQGTLAPYLKSAPEPTADQMAKTKTTLLVGSTFDDLVTNADRDVLISFYAPWCTLCAKLDPEYEDLAGRVEDVEDLVIAKMDASVNDMPAEYDVRSLPSMYLSHGVRGRAMGKPLPVRVEVSAAKGKLAGELIKYLRNSSKSLDLELSLEEDDGDTDL